jgi:hypothetical protein
MDVVEIIEKLDSIGYIRANKIMNEYYQIYCPIHKGGQERRPSFGILIREEVRNGRIYPQGWCHCFSCNYVNTLPGLIEDILKNMSISQTGLDWLRDNIDGFDVAADFEYLIPPGMTDDLMNIWDQSKIAVSNLASLQKPKYEYVSEEELASYRFTIPYMYERGLTDEIIEKYDVGFDINFRLPGRKEITPTLTFPVRDMLGRTQYIYRRGVESKIFFMPEGLDKPLYGIYELDKSTKRLIICEAILNALKVISFGESAVALMATGNSIQIEQVRQLGIREIILGFDADYAGSVAENKWKKALRDVAIVWCYRNYPQKEDGEYKDLNDLTLEEFRALTLE